METKLLVSEMFYSLQGEGRTMGRPSVFLRLGACNLLCGGHGTDKDGKLHDGAKWRCDTIEVWQKGLKYTPASLIIEMNQNLKYTDLLKKGVRTIITGGEPLLQANAIAQFIHIIENDFKISGIYEIETNGTIKPPGQLTDSVHIWNVSPKLSNSGMPYEKRLKSDVLIWFNNQMGTMFKFVVADHKDMDEVRNIINMYELDPRKIWLMPAASTLSELIRRNKLVAEFCIEYHFNFSSRLQVEIWDKTTGV